MVNQVSLLTLSIILTLAAFASCAGSEQTASTERIQATSAITQAETDYERLHPAIRLIPG